MIAISNNAVSNPVLIIEDDISQLETLGDIIESEGFQPICCKSDIEAIDTLKQREVNVAILDLRLGHVDGMSVLKQLKEHNPQIKVIINTAYASLESAMTAVNEEAFAYVVKMDDVETLLSHIHRAFHEHYVRYTETLRKEVEKRTRELTISNENLKKEINERMNAEEALQEKTDELARSNSQLEDFAYIASHDMQEPLHTIQAFCDLIIKKYSGETSDKVLTYLSRIYKAAERMYKLIDNLLILSRVKRSGMPYVQVELKEIVNNVVSDYKGIIDEINAKVTIDKLPAIQADLTQMHQLFANLIGNSVKYHTKDGTPKIKIYSESPGGENDNDPPNSDNNTTCRIIIKDNGIGFHIKNLERIFQPFERLHGQSAYEGTGMGLAICQSIVDRHGGSITANSKTGKGTTMIITLPVTQNK